MAIEEIQFAAQKTSKTQCEFHLLQKNIKYVILV